MGAATRRTLLRRNVKRVYLAGPIANCTGDQARGWRTEASNYLAPLGILTRNPALRPMRGSETVEEDLQDIRLADAVIANCWKPSVGTSMEIMYAYMQSIPVHVVGQHLSPWITTHADSVHTDHWEALRHVVQTLHVVRS